jgi:phage-related protein
MATILVEILGSAKQFKAELDGAVASTEKANGGFAKMSKAAGIAGLAIAGGLAFGLKKAVDAAEEMQQSTARMDAAFAASHVSAKAFSGAIDDAEVSSRKLGFQNDSVRNSLGSLIVATHNGKAAIADLAIAEDIARFKHISLESATKNLTMAMAGSQRATKQLGIDVPKVTTNYDTLKATFGKTIDASEKLALAHAKLTDKMATSNLVIATVSEKLHGQAKAYSETAAGGMEQFHAQLNNLAESLGVTLLPALTVIATELASLAVFFSDNMEITKLVVIGLAALAAVLLTVSVATKIYAAGVVIAQAVTKTWTAAQWLLNVALDANPIGLVVIAIAALVAGIIIAYEHSKTFRTIVTGALNAISTAAQAVLDFFRDNWKTIAILISGPFAPVVILATNAFGVRSALEGAIKDIVGFFKALPSQLLNALGDVSTLLYNAGTSIIQGLENGIKAKLNDVKNVVGGIAGTISSLKGPIDYDRTLLIPHGQAIIQGLQTGLASGLDSLNRMTSGIAPSISANVAASTSPAVGGAGATHNYYINAPSPVDPRQIAAALSFQTRTAGAMV